MLKSVDHISREDAQRERRHLGVALISILDKSEQERHRRPPMNGYRLVLVQTFEDTHEATKGRAPGDWPDEPSLQEHAMYSQDWDERIPSLSDAREIVRFIERVHQLPEPIDLLVHCFAGVSRSGAVARYVMQRYGVPLRKPEVRYPGHPNPRLLRLLHKAGSAL